MMNVFNLGIFSSIFGSFTDSLKELLISLAVVIGILFIIIALIKYENGRLFILTALTIAFLGFSVFCGIELNTYYSAKGGIVGNLGNAFSNQVEIYNNLEFELSNISLTKRDNDCYQLDFSTYQNVDISMDANYCMLLNGIPCENVVYSNLISSNDNMICKFKYNFYDDKGTYVLSDSLTIKARFDEKCSYFTISTGVINSTNLKNIDFWNEYFARNGLVLQFKPVDNVYVRVDYHKVRYYYNDEYVGVVKVPDGWDYTLPTSVKLDKNCEFFGWKLDGQDVTELKNITEDIDVHADIRHYNLFSFYTSIEGDTLGLYGVDGYGNQKIYDGGSLQSVPSAPSYNNVTFVGYSLSSNLNSDEIYDDVASLKFTPSSEFIPIYLIYRYSNYDFSLVADKLLKFTLNNVNYSSTGDLTVKYNRKINFSNIQLVDNYEFIRWSVTDNLGNIIYVDNINFNYSPKELLTKLNAMNDVESSDISTTFEINMLVVNTDSASSVADNDLHEVIESYFNSGTSISEMSNDEYMLYLVKSIHGSEDESKIESTKFTLITSIKNDVKSYLSSKISNFDEKNIEYLRFDFSYHAGQSSREYLEQLYLIISRFTALKSSYGN